MTPKTFQNTFKSVRSMQDNYNQVLSEMITHNVVTEDDLIDMTLDHVAQWIYFSAGCNAQTRQEAMSLTANGKACAWSDKGDIIGYIAYLIADEWRPFGLVDRIRFNRGTGEALSTQDTCHYQDDIVFDGCLETTSNDDYCYLTGWELMKIASRCTKALRQRRPKRLKYILQKMQEERERLSKAQEQLRKEPEFINVDTAYGAMWFKLERSREELYVCIRELEDLYNIKCPTQ